jgi:hypothetical protein
LTVVYVGLLLLLDLFMFISNRLLTPAALI